MSSFKSKKWFFCSKTNLFYSFLHASNLPYVLIRQLYVVRNVFQNSDLLPSAPFIEIQEIFQLPLPKCTKIESLLLKNLYIPCSFVEAIHTLKFCLKINMEKFLKMARLTKETKKVEMQIFQESLSLSKSSFVDKFNIGGVTITLKEL